jgi:thiosulfate reductase cytochrome b subunit
LINTLPLVYKHFGFAAAADAARGSWLLHFLNATTKIPPLTAEANAPRAAVLFSTRFHVPTCTTSLGTSRATVLLKQTHQTNAETHTPSATFQGIFKNLTSNLTVHFLLCILLLSNFVSWLLQSKHTPF